MSETQTPALQYRFDGPEDAPVLILGPSLGTTWHMWDRQVPELAKQWRVFRFDLPGHGGAPAYPAGSVAELADRLLATLDALGVQRFGYAGCALGGAVGVELALRHPERLASLALIAASPRFGTADEFRQRGVIVRTNGLDPIARTSPERWFTGGLRRRPARDHRVGRADGAHHRPRLLHRRLRGARRVRRPRRARPRSACRPSSSSAPTTRSPAPPRPAPWSPASRTPGSPSCPAPPTWCPVEQPAAVTDLLVRHFSTAWQPAYDSATGQTAIPAAPVKPVLAAAPPQPRPVAEIAPAAAQPEARGPTRPVRRRASRSAARCSATRTSTGRWPQADEFSGDFQEFITRYAWGEIWDRPGLDRRSRSCVTLTALVAGGHLDELAFHTRAALRNGLTPDEIKEVLLQAAVYCGVPAANSAFKVAQQVIREETTPTE